MHDLRHLPPASELIAKSDAAADWLRHFLSMHRPLVLTGAGISIASGLPAYRDHAGRWQHAQPMQHRDFVDSHTARQRYWLRALAGWNAFSGATPSPVHHVLSTWQESGCISAIATQNVDALHQRAGSRCVIDLHGRLDLVTCLDCGAKSTRESMQERLIGANPDSATANREVRKPDGDTGIETVPPDFVVPECTNCGGRLKPDVVFFGDTVPAKRVDAVQRALDAAQALLVIGSSLTVYSGFRVARWASEAQYPLVLLNPGQTRADPIADVRLAVDAQHVLPIV